MNNLYVEATRDLLKKRLFTHEPVDGDSWTKHSTASRRTAYRTIRDLLQHTILKGERNSFLVIGPKSSGKTFLVNEVLRDLDSDVRCKGNYLLVKLSGLLHTDDRLALLDIAMQLDVDSDLLEGAKMSFSRVLDCVLQTLLTGDVGNKSVIFLLDQFDLFTKHKNQTLLYNLLDLTRATSIPLAVVGVSDKVNVEEMLEKRVRSRLSNMKVHLEVDYTFDDYVTIFRDALTLPGNHGDLAYRKKWNSSVQHLCAHRQVVHCLSSLHAMYCNIHTLKVLLTSPVCRLSRSHPFIQPGDIVESLSMLSRDRRVDALRGLSVLELCLVIASTHVSIVSDYEPFNFEMVYQEYKKFAQRCHSIQLFKKPVAMKAFDNLEQLKIVCPADGSETGVGKSMREFRMMALNVVEDQVKEAVKTYPNCPTDVIRWAGNRGGALIGI